MKELICIVCPRGCRLRVSEDGSQTEGNACPRGAAYAQAEVTNPTRTLTSTVRVLGGLRQRLPVKTASPIPKSLLGAAMKELRELRVQAPVREGAILIPDLLRTGVPLVATRDDPGGSVKG